MTVERMRLTEKQVSDLTADLVSDETRVSGSGLRVVPSYHTRVAVPAIVRSYCRAVNAGRITRYTAAEDARREMTGFLPSFVLWWIGKEAAIRLLVWLWRRVWRDSATEPEDRQAGAAETDNAAK